MHSSVHDVPMHFCQTATYMKPRLYISNSDRNTNFTDLLEDYFDYSNL